jgi:hypothetical protein
VDALTEAGALTGRHALTAQLLVATAERAGYGLHEPRTTIATTNLLRLLADLLRELPLDTTSVGTEAEQFLRELAAAEAAARQ